MAQLGRERDEAAFAATQALNQFEEIRGPERKTRPHSRVTGQGKQDEELKK
jgi:hypothetical protein